MSDDDYTYEEFLSDQIKKIEPVLMRLLVAHMREKGKQPIDPDFEIIRDFLNEDDWYIDLNEEDQKIVAVNEGWYCDDWGPGPWRAS